MHEYGSVINGRQVASGHWLEVFNPFSRKLVGRVAALDKDSVILVLEETRRTQVRLTRYERNQILNRIADHIEQNVESVSRMITDEAGLSLKDTTYEAARVSDVFRFAAIKTLEDDSQVFPCDVSRNGKARRIYTTRFPLNLVAAITPFNHPMNQVAHKIAPAIATNNTVVLKPSSKTPLSAYYLAQLALDCGLPANMLNVVSGPVSEVIDPIIRSELVELITFTGSTAVGKYIASNAGYKRLVLELGGSSAMLVLEDADVEQAAELAVIGTFKNSGQRCTAIRRLVVHQAIADDFAARLAEKANRLKCGDPYNPNTEMGTVIDEESALQMESRVNDAINRGAKLLTGNRREGALYPPTVVDRVENDFPLVAQETFGPIASIIRFQTLDQAIQIANDTPYGLSGAVVSNHWPSIQKVINELETGTVNVNEAPSYRLEWTPFGGIKNSGLGYKEGIIEAMKGMTNIKTYSLPWDIA